MKLNKTMIAAFLAFGVTSAVNAADMGHGSVSFKGAIIDAPCSISSDSVDQTVDLGEVSAAALENSGTSAPKNFKIALQNCSLGLMKSVTATFTGAAGAGGRLGVTGTAKGASIALTDGANNVVKLGEASQSQSLQDGNNTLSFSAYLQGDGSAVDIVPGDFTGITDFTLSYQ